MSVASAALAARRLLADARVGWSVGRPGALAEFYWSDTEGAVSDDLGVRTPRGAIRLELPDDVRVFAAEALGHGASGWNQWIAFCLPADAAAMSGRSRITETGADLRAIRPQDRTAVLFDLGLGGAHYHVCVRTDRDDTLRLLRSAAGKRLLEDTALIHALVRLSPSRVFESRCARIEVLQPIAAPGGTSPEGPHTHILPELLGAPPQDPTAPAGWVAQAVAYPPHPLRDAFGRSQTFDPAAFAGAQAWLEDYGDPGHLAVKRLVMDAVRSGADPQRLAGRIDDSRRDAVRIGLRQLRCIDGESESLARWLAVYEC